MKYLLLLIVKFYQRMLRLRTLVGKFLLFPQQTCRFRPTCSEYVTQAVGSYGIIRGGWMGMKRILRCNPFNEGGYDPV